MHCNNHSQREAVAICPECSSPFCRECITEHEYRVICAGCLSKISASSETAAKKKHTLPYIPVFPLIQAAAGLALTYTLFHATGDLLARLPTTYHEGSYMEGVVDFMKDPTKFDEEE